MATMSKDIWHTADITPDPYRSFVINTDKRNIYTGIITNPTEWNPMILPEFYDIEDIDKAERAIRYAYLDDLLALETDLKRTRKALEIAVDALKVYANPENWDFEHFYSLETYDIASGALEQIKTALKQKD